TCSEGHAKAKIEATFCRGQESLAKQRPKYQITIKSLRAAQCRFRKQSSIVVRLPMLNALLQTARPAHGRSFASIFRHLGALGLFFLAILDSSPVPTFGGP